MTSRATCCASTNPDSSVTCTFVGNFTGVAGDTETDIAEIDAIDENGNPVDDNDDAIVTITPAPVVQIVKTVTPGQRPEPGGNFTFTLVISNPGPTDLTLGRRWSTRSTAICSTRRIRT